MQSKDCRKPEHAQVNNDVTIVSPGFYRPKALARSLVAKGRLAGYVTGFNDVSGNYARRARTLPLVGASIAAQFQRRRPPEGIPAELIVNAATAEELVRAIAERAPWARHHLAQSLDARLILRISQQLAKRTARQPHGSAVLYGTYGTLLEALEAPTWRDSLRVLDYPQCHHATLERILREDRLRNGNIFETEHDDPHTKLLAARFDREIEKVDRVLVGSEFVARSFFEQGIPVEKVKVMTYGVDTTRFSPGAFRPSDEGPFRILYAGSLTRRKGIHYLLEACSMLPKEQISVQLAGGAPRQLAWLAPYEGSFEHIPFTPQETLAKLYQQASVFVLPSLAEGLGLVVLEAMASGLPVIATDRGQDQAVRDGIDGFIVPASDPQAIADRIQLLMADDNLRFTMGQAARKRAISLTIDSYVAEVTTWLDSLLKWPLQSPTLSANQ